MKKDRSLFSKILIVLVVLIFIFAFIKSIKHNINVNKIDDYQNTITKYTEVLDKYVFGDYEKEYDKINDESNKAIITKNPDNIDKLKNKYKVLTEKVKSAAPSEIEGYYNEVKALDLSVLGDKDKDTISKDIDYLRTLIDKKYYRVSYNETVRIKKKVKKAEEKQKKALEEAQKKAEEDKKKAEEEAKKNNANVGNQGADNNTDNNAEGNKDANANADTAQGNNAGSTDNTQAQ